MGRQGSTPLAGERKKTTRLPPLFTCSGRDNRSHQLPQVPVLASDIHVGSNPVSRHTWHGRPVDKPCARRRPVMSNRCHRAAGAGLVDVTAHHSRACRIAPGQRQATGFVWMRAIAVRPERCHVRASTLRHV